MRLVDGSGHRVDIVVSAADGYSTIFGMLGGRFIDQRIRDCYATWPMFPRKDKCGIASLKSRTGMDRRWALVRCGCRVPDDIY